MARRIGLARRWWESRQPVVKYRATASLFCSDFWPMTWAPAPSQPVWGKWMGDDTLIPRPQSATLAGTHPPDEHDP